MKLYSIRRPSDRKFFVNTDGNGKPYFSDTPGSFLRTPEGVASNLRRLCSDYAPTPNRHGWLCKNWKNFDAAKLAQYEVLIMEVDIVSMTATPATEFAQVDAIANARVIRTADEPPIERGTG